MGYRGMGSMGNGAQGYGPHRQWGTGVWGTWAIGAHGVQGVWAMWAMGYMGYRGMSHMGKGGPWAICSLNIKKMSSCQKDVKCQKMKHLNYGGGSQKN